MPHYDPHELVHDNSLLPLVNKFWSYEPAPITQVYKIDVGHEYTAGIVAKVQHKECNYFEWVLFRASDMKMMPAKYNTRKEAVEYFFSKQIMSHLLSVLDYTGEHLIMHPQDEKKAS